MKKLLFTIQLLVLLNACSKHEIGVISDKQNIDSVHCSFVIHTYDIIDPFVYTVDSCSKYDLRDTVSLKNLK